MATSALVMVPEGATTGPLTLTSDGGATAAPTFTVTPGASPLNLSIPHLWLTQAVQTPDGTVPLVAGRDAFLWCRCVPTS